MQTLKGRTVLITGFNGNIGQELVKEVAAAGMNIILATHGPHKPKPGEKPMEGPAGHGGPQGHGAPQGGPMGGPPHGKSPMELFLETLPEEQRNRSTIIKCVAEDERDIEDKFAEAVKVTGGIDCVVFLHGRSREYKEQDFATLDPEYVEMTLMNHVVTTYHGLRAAIPYLEQSKAGRVVFLADTEAKSGSDRDAMAVTMAKGALISLTKSAAKRLGSKGITVNCVAPAGIMNVPPQPNQIRGSGRNAPEGTTFGAANWILEEELYAPEDFPVKRLGNSADVANAICYLLSEEAGFVTGEVLNINGGIYLD
jgi:3-oxoacyl-[acyl-carrier protein] reductase